MDWNGRARKLLGERILDDDVLAELGDHAAAVYAAARAEGASIEEATRLADEQLAMGPDAVRGLTRRRRRPDLAPPPPAAAAGWVGLGEELRSAVRLLLRERAHSLLVVLTLATGIGVATVLFSVVNGVLLSPLPWPHAERLVRLAETREGASRQFPWTVTNGTYLALAPATRSLEALGGWTRDTVTWSDGAEAERVRTVSVTAGLFPMLEARALLGSTFTQADEKAGGVVVLSYGLWQRRFGGRRDVIGRLVRLDGRPHRVVGVMPRGFAFPDAEAGAWTPFEVTPVVQPDGSRAMDIFGGMGRLREGATPAQAAEEATLRARQAPDPGLVTMAFFGSRGQPRVSAVPVQQALTSEVRPALMMLLAGIGLLLAAAVANVASLQLVRATARRRELAVRAALGAARGRIARLLLAESLLLALAGGLLALVVAALAHRALPALLPVGFPRAEAIVIDLRVAGFGLLLALVSGAGAGVLPALFGGRLRITEALAEDAPASAGPGRSAASRARSAILVGQVAVAAVLLLGAVQLGRSFLGTLQARRGYDADHLLTLRLPMPEPVFTPVRRAQLVDAVLERLQGMPGVSQAAMASVLPLDNSETMVAWAVVSPAGEEKQASAIVRQVSAGYFRALGRRVVEGRPLLESDTAGTQAVAVVNRTFARRYLDDRAIGASLPMGLDPVKRAWTVVGVVEDLVQRSPTDPVHPEVIACWRQFGPGLSYSEPALLVRTAADPVSLIPAVRTVLRDADASLAPDSIVPMRQRLQDSLAQPRLYALVLAAFAASAVVVAGVGLFGALSYGVALRRREIGVRLALGARPAQIATLVAAQALRLAVAGVVAGLLLSMLLGRALSGLLYGIGAHDAAALLAVPAALLLLAGAVSIVPAWRAARTDPQRALRAE